MAHTKGAALPGFTANSSIYTRLGDRTSLGWNRIIDNQLIVIPQIVDPEDGAACLKVKEGSCNPNRRVVVGRDFCGSGFAMQCHDALRGMRVCLVCI